MALHKCPECRHKISQNAMICPHCGFSFETASLEKYKQMLEQRRLHNQQINKKSAKLQFIWLIIFSLFIALAGYFTS